MQVITTATQKANTYTTAFRSEYFSDVLTAVAELEANYIDRCYIESMVTVIDMDAADCLYYGITVVYYNLGAAIPAHIARQAGLKAENDAWVAAEAAKATQAAAGAEKPVIVNGIALANPSYKADGMKSTVGKFVKWM